MKAKKWTILCVGAMISTLALSLCACDVGSALPQDPQTPSVNLYDVATQLGYETESEWAASVSGASSEARKMYMEAKSDGYEGTFVEFLKEIGCSVSYDNSVSVSSALTSIVSVTASFQSKTYSYTGFGGKVERETTVAKSGSGVIYSLNKDAGDAYIITNYHVVYEASSTGRESTKHISDNAYVFLYGSVQSESSAIRAIYVGGSMEYDIAVLKVTGNELIKKSSARPLVCADSDAVSAGQTVYAIGNADGKGISVTQGVVSVESEYIQMTLPDGTSAVRLVMRTDAALNHGNSGGGLFNADGALVGIVDARSEESGIEAFGYVIPSNIALSIARNVIDNQENGAALKGALRATMGITIQTTDSHCIYDEKTQKAYIIETTTVNQVNEGKAASGVLRAGDVIYSVTLSGGEKQVITRRGMLDWLLFEVRKGESIQMEIYRGEELQTVTITFDGDDDFTSFH